MSMELHNQMSIDSIHQKIISIKAELESFRQHPTLGPYVPSVAAMLQRLKDDLGMMDEHAEIRLSQYVVILTTCSLSIKDHWPELSKSLAELSEKGINAGLWGVVSEPPLSAKDLDPAQDLDQAQKEVTKEEFKAIFIKYGKSQLPPMGEGYWNQVYEPRLKDNMRYIVRLPKNSKEDNMMIVDGGNELRLFFMTDDRVEAFFDFPGKDEL